MGKYVMLLEIGRKQKYIFSSNRLAENIGASIIIKNATEKDAREIHENMEQSQQPDVIYEGGGNCLYVFPTPEAGMDFARQYSNHIITAYPGITLYLVGYELQDGESVQTGINTCYRLLAQKKNSREHTAEMMDFGNTVRCASTNLPAMRVEDWNDYRPKALQSKPISAESMKKYEVAGKEQDNVFGELLPKENPDGKRWAFPHEFDQLGRTVDEKSYIAVVHIDGNRMGQKIQAFNNSMKRNPETETQADFDKRYIEELGNLSREIREKYTEAFRETVQVIADNMPKLRDELTIHSDQKKSGEMEYLPIRPLIMAGDDICFVTDGRIGIETARVFLEHIQKKEVQNLPMHACGGVALVKSHFPFSRAYDLSEELCQNAKDAIGGEDAKDASYLDWHIDQGELDDSLSAIRVNYQISEHEYLNMRPYRVGVAPSAQMEGKGSRMRQSNQSGPSNPVSQTGQSERYTKGNQSKQPGQPGYGNPSNPADQQGDISRLYGHFIDAWETITNRKRRRSEQPIARSKIKGLRDVAHYGQEAGKYYIQANQLQQLDAIDWKSGEGGYTRMEDGSLRHIFYDAMEVMDVFIRLEDADNSEGKNGEKNQGTGEN